MSPYPLKSFLAVCVFAAVHLFAHKARRFERVYSIWILSIGGGIAISYVFVDILPKLSRHEPLISRTIRWIFPYFEKHVYVIALLGFLLFLSVDRSKNLLRNNSAFFYFSISSYALLNLLLGYAVADLDNPEVRPLLLFTLAMGLHYFANDYSLTSTLGKQYDHIAKWILIGCLFAGWFIGLVIELSAAAVAMVSAFIGGGVIMNVTRHELPEGHVYNLLAFLAASIAYATILMTIG